MASDGLTKPLAMVGRGCALCGTEGQPGVSVPVVRASGPPAFPHVCRSCLGLLLAIVLQLLGHQAARLAELATTAD